MPIELGFILERLAEMAEQDESLRERQPWKAAHEQDHAWLGGVITKHYAGDDETAAGSFVRQGQHPSLGRTFGECAYAPMIELLDYLEANGFMSYIASRDRDFMRPITHEI
jgi:hypothetical protein